MGFGEAGGVGCGFGRFGGVIAQPADLAVDRAGDVEAAGHGGGGGVGHKHAKAAADVAQVAFQGQQDHVGVELAAAVAGLGAEAEFGDAGPVEGAAHHFAKAGAGRGGEQGAGGHAAHFHSGKLDQMLPGQSEAGDFGRDPFKDKGVFQQVFQPARVDLGAVGDAAAAA